MLIYLLIFKINFFERSNLGLLLLESIRDEAHRFAITYHRDLRDKRNLKSKLLEIEGIGKVRRDALYKEFKTIDILRSLPIKKASSIFLIIFLTPYAGII